MNESEHCGERLKAWRAKRHLSQNAAARLLGIGRSYYSQLENGRESEGLALEKFKLIEHEPVHSVNNRSSVSNAEIVNVGKVPVVSWAKAGEATDYDELPLDWQKTVPKILADPKAFAVEVAGDSMEPRYHAGDVAYLSPSEPVHQNETVIARIKDQGVVFKIYSRKNDTVTLSSYNPAYKPFDVPVDQISWIYPVHYVMKILKR